MKAKTLAIGAMCAITVAFLGCSDSNGKKESDTDKSATTTVVGQSDPVAVAKAWWEAATEENADRLLALTAEEAREDRKRLYGRRTCQAAPDGEDNGEDLRFAHIRSRQENTGGEDAADFEG